MQQYFIAQSLHIGEVVQLDKETQHHQLSVLRAHQGDSFRLADSDGRLFLAKLQIKDTGAFAEIIEEIDEMNEMMTKVTIIQALIKGERWDYFLQKATECGVNRIIPFLSERNVVKFDSQTDAKKLDRWRKIVREAAEQSRRNIIPDVVMPITSKDLSNYLGDANYVAYELEAGLNRQLKERDTFPESVSVLIGSEGGFSPREIHQFTALGFTPVGLGKRILRAETAAIVALTLIESKSERN